MKQSLVSHRQTQTGSDSEAEHTLIRGNLLKCGGGRDYWWLQVTNQGETN